MPNATVRASAIPLPEIQPDTDRRAQLLAEIASFAPDPNLVTKTSASRNPRPRHAPKAKTSEPSDDPVFRAISKHTIAECLLESTELDLVSTPDGLSTYSRWEQDEETAFNRIVFRTIPTTAAGYKAIIKWTLSYLNRHCSDGEFYTIGHVLANFESGEFFNRGSEEKEEAKDPIFTVITALAQAGEHAGDAAHRRLLLTVPTTRTGIRAMATFAWQNHYKMDRAMFAAILTSFLRSPALNPIPANKRPEQQPAVNLPHDTGVERSHAAGANPAKSGAPL